jgi:hypothetical protein
MGERVFEILEKDKVGEEDYIYFCLEACATSCRFGTITEYEVGKKHIIRGNINVFLRMPLGAGKTTTIIDIPNSNYTNRITYPSLVGTITKDGRFIEGEIVRSAGKVLILDEFSNIPSDVKEALNNLLEQKPHSRSLGTGNVISPVNKRGKFLKLKVRKNRVDLWARFSCIASSIFRESDNLSIAWSTRFLPINFIPSMEYYERLSRGEVYFKVNPKPVDSDFVFRDFLKANKYYWDTFKSKPYYGYFLVNRFAGGYSVRALHDLVRLSAFLTSLEGRKVIKLDDFKLVCDKFLDFFFWNFISSGLGEDELKILFLYKPDKTIKDLSTETGFSVGKVHKIVKKLQQSYLLPFVVG